MWSRKRASSANSLISEFIGDYNAITAVTIGVCLSELRCFRGFSALAAWNDVRNADSCDAVNAYRSALRGVTGPNAAVDWGEDRALAAISVTTPSRPFPPGSCGASSRFGNTDIYGGTYAPPLG